MGSAPLVHHRGLGSVPPGAAGGDTAVQGRRQVVTGRRGGNAYTQVCMLAKGAGWTLL